mgnify:CR=1 FL=1
MKRLLYLATFAVFGGGILISCEPDSVEPEIFDSAPSITITSPGSYIIENLDFNMEFKINDGVSEEISISPLESAEFVILDSDTSDVVVPEVELAVGGILTEVDQVFDNNLPVGSYVLRVVARDTRGNETVALKRFQVIEDYVSISIIGSATPGGWDSDTNMTRDAGNPILWKINDLVLTAGAAKFRANGNWTVNWGATGFPTGTGTQDGPDIPIIAGTYDIELNVITGQYRFQ